MCAEASPSIGMSERQKRILEKASRKHTLSVALVRRIKVLLYAAEGQSNYGIHQTTGMNLISIQNWRSRWTGGHVSLCEFEEGKFGQTVSDHDLLEKMLELVTDRPRSGAPAKISMEQKNQIVALACEKPEDYGIPVTNWTLEILAHVAMQIKIVDQISTSYVGQILKKKT